MKSGGSTKTQDYSKSEEKNTYDQDGGSLNQDGQYRSKSVDD